MVRAVRDDLKPVIDSLATSQAELRAQVARSREEVQGVADDVRTLRNWVMSDVLSKLQA